MGDLTVDAVVDAYLKVRNRKAAIKAKAEEEISKLDAQLSKMEGWIKTKADKEGVTSFRTDHGTAFLTTVDYASVADWDQIIDFIKTHAAYDMLEKRISKNAVKGYINANKAVPPGVNYGTKIEVNVRKPGTKVDE